MAIHPIATLSTQEQVTGKLNSPSAASAFSSASTYAVGAYCTYEGVLYKCTTAVTSAGAWTGEANWTAVTVMESLPDLSAYALKTAERYDLKTVTDAQLLDRTINTVAPTAETTLVFPAAVDGKARDFAVRIEQGETAYSVNFPAGGIAYEGDSFPAMEASKNYLVSLTETKSGTFFVRAFELTVQEG